MEDCSISGHTDLLLTGSSIPCEEGTSQKSSNRNLPVKGPDEAMVFSDYFAVIVHMDSGNAAVCREFISIACRPPLFHGENYDEVYG